MTILHTPAGLIELADSIHDLSALAYTRFNQAWLKASGLATDGHAIQEHLARHAAFLSTGETEAAAVSFNNLVAALNAQEAGEPLLAAILAPAVRSIAGVAYTTLTPDGLNATADAILASGITQGALAEAVENLKKKYSAN